jgi:hypothetical protein
MAKKRLGLCCPACFLFPPSPFCFAPSLPKHVCVALQQQTTLSLSLSLSIFSAGALHFAAAWLLVLTSYRGTRFVKVSEELLLLSVRLSVCMSVCHEAPSPLICCILGFLSKTLPSWLFVCLLFCIMRKYLRVLSACTTRLEERKRD